MKTKRLIAFMLLAITVFTSIPLDSLFVEAIGNNITLPSGKTVELESDIPLTRNISGTTYNLNLKLLENKRIVVYGDHSDINQSSSSDYKNGEWRYLGYDMSGNPYLNNWFPRDADSGRHASEKDWIYKPWEQGLVTQSSYYREPQDPQLGGWLKSMDWSESDRKGQSPSSYPEEFLIERFHLQSTPGKYTQGIARGWHNSGGGVWYQAFAIPATEKKPFDEKTDVNADFDIKNEVYEYQDVGYVDRSSAENSHIVERVLTITGNDGYSRIIENQERPNIQLKEGIYTFRLDVENDSGQQDHHIDIIRVIKENMDESPESDPIALVNSPDSANLGETFTVSAKGSMASIGAKIINYEWHLGDSPTNLIHNPDHDGMEEINVSYDTEGSKYFQVKIKDTAGKEALSNVAETKIEDNTPTDVDAVIEAPAIVYEGVPFNVYTSNSSVIYGDERMLPSRAVNQGIARYSYATSFTRNGRLFPEGGEIWTEDLGLHTIKYTLRTKDATDTDTATIDVLPTPATEFSIGGRKKENRRLVLDTTETYAHINYPLVDSETVIIIENKDTEERVTITEASSPNTRNIKTKAFRNGILEFTIKEAGNYEAIVTTEDTRGKSSTLTKSLRIDEDLEPIADYITPEIVFRNALGEATIKITKNHKSPDNDIIGTQILKYRYDTNKDGRLSDEDFNEIPVYEDEIEFTISQVGEIEIDFFVQEDFDHIPEHVSSSDFLSHRKTSKVIIDNIAPITSFNLIERRNIDFAFFTDSSSVQNTLSYANDLKESLNDHADLILDVNTSVDDVDTSDEPIEELHDWHQSEEVRIFSTGNNESAIIELSDSGTSGMDEGLYSLSWSEEGLGYNLSHRFGLSKSRLSNESYSRKFEYKENGKWYSRNFIYNISENKIKEIDIANGTVIKEFDITFPFTSLNNLIIDNNKREKLIFVRQGSSDARYTEVDYSTGEKTLEKTVYGTYFGEDKEWIYSYEDYTQSDSNKRNNDPSKYIQGFKIYRTEKEDVEAEPELLIQNEVSTLDIISRDHLEEDRSRWDVGNDTSHIGGTSLSPIIHNDKIIIPYTNRYQFWERRSSSRRYYRNTGLIDNVMVIDKEGNTIKKTNVGNRYRNITDDSVEASSIETQIIEEDYILINFVASSNFRQNSTHTTILDENFNLYFNISQLGNNTFSYGLVNGNLQGTFWRQASLVRNGTRFYTLRGTHFPSGEEIDMEFRGDRDIRPAFMTSIDKENRYVAIGSNATTRNPIRGSLIDLVDYDRNEEIPVLEFSDDSSEHRRRLSGRVVPIGDGGNQVVILMDSLSSYYNYTTGEMFSKAIEKSYMPEYTYSYRNISPDGKHLLVVHNHPNWSAANIRQYKLNPGFFEDIINKLQKYEFRKNSKDNFVVIKTKESIDITQSQISEIVNLANSKNAKILFLGNSSNSTIGQQLASGTGGIFEVYSTEADAFSKINNYIEDTIAAKGNNLTINAKAGQPIIYNTFYDDYENDPSHEVSGERWRFNHYHSPDGKIDDHNTSDNIDTWLTKPLEILNKVGRYLVTFIKKDDPVKDNDNYDEYRKWSKTQPVEIIVSGEGENIEPEEIDPTITIDVQGEIEGKLRTYRRVDFLIDILPGTRNLDEDTLDITFNTNDYLPYEKPNTLRFSRVFENEGSHIIEVSIDDLEGNTYTETVDFTLYQQEKPIAGFNLTTDGVRNDDGSITYKIEDLSEESLNPIGKVEYQSQVTEYEAIQEEGELGELTPIGTKRIPLEVENREINFEIGEYTIWQVVEDYYINGIGLAGEDLDKYRQFQTAEISETITINNKAPTLEYNVTPNLIVVGDTIGHNVDITDDTLGGDYATYRFTRSNSFYSDFYEQDITFKNYDSSPHENENATTDQATEKLNKTGNYSFYATAHDEDGASSDEVHGGNVLVMNLPISDFDLQSPGEITTEDGDKYFKTGNSIKLTNQSYSPDYWGTVQNQGISEYKLELRNVSESQYQTIKDYTNLKTYVNTVTLSNIDEVGVYELRQTVKTPEGLEHVSTKKFTVLDLYMDSEVIPGEISSGQEYTINAEISKDGHNVIAYIPYLEGDNRWINLDKVNEDENSKYFSKIIQTEETLLDDNYNIEVYGIYPFGAEIKHEHNLRVNTPVELKSTITPIAPEEYSQVITRGDGENDSIKVPASEKIEISATVDRPNKEDGTPITVKYVKATLEGESPITLTYNTETNQYEGIINVRETKPDADYSVIVETEIANGNKDSNNHSAAVNTPINLIGSIPSDVVTDTSIPIIATTSKYANKTNVTLFKGQDFERTLTFNSTRQDNKNQWLRNYSIPSDIPEGEYIVEFRATTPNGNTEVVSKRIRVHTLRVSAYLMPNPAMAGDKVYFYITTEGYADRIDIIVPDAIVSKDNRSSMEYSSVSYPLRFYVDDSVNVKEDIFEYIVWISTDLTLDKNNSRLRQPYKFKVRAYKEDIMRETELELDIKGDVRQFLKPGIKNKYGN